MEKRNPVPLKLVVDSADVALLRDTVAEFLWAATYVTHHAFEDLTDIRERTGASWGHNWAFSHLYEYVAYKAAAYGIAGGQVDPENTSRRCSECGFTHPDNRESGAFECLKRGYEKHADYNAAKNIGLRYLRRNQTGAGGGAPVGVC